MVLLAVLVVVVVAVEEDMFILSGLVMEGDFYCVGGGGELLF